MSSKRSAILSLGGAEKDPSFGKDTSEEAEGMVKIEGDM